MELTTAQKTTSFFTQKETNGNAFFVDKRNNISRVAWFGKVDLAIASEMLKLGGTRSSSTA